MLTLCTTLLNSVMQETQFLKHVVRHLTVTWHEDMSCATEQLFNSSTTC